MKIGVFGDSFAADNQFWCEKTNTLPSSDPFIWWKLLENFGHEVTSFGQEGTSILYSINQIKKNYSKFDFIIWCCTQSSRITLPIDERPGYLNSSTFLDQEHTQDKFILDSTHKKIQLLKDWFRYAHNQKESELIGLALVNLLLSKFDNLMIIPCFDDPCFTNFDLFSLSQREIKNFFPDHDLESIHKNYTDLRSCHLTKENNIILAELINSRLQPGIFSADYNEFNFTADRLQQYFKPVKS